MAPTIHSSSTAPNVATAIVARLNPSVIAKAQQRSEHEAAEQGADDADDQVGDETVLAAGDLLGNPSRDEADKDPSEKSHGLTPL